jgi:glycosyltransferase involved in cell wall biosynthesis
MIKVTVITAAFRIEGLKNVFEVLKNQEYQNFNHIIVNDGQPSIREFIKSKGLNNNERFIDLPERLGGFGGWSRNIGVMATNQTEWLTFLDDDNEWEPRHLRLMVEEIEKDPSINLVATDCLVKGKKDLNYKHIRKCAFAPQNIDLGQILYKKDLFFKYGFFYPRGERRITFDWELIERMQFEPMKIINEPTFIFYHRRR